MALSQTSRGLTKIDLAVGSRSGTKLFRGERPRYGLVLLSAIVVFIVLQSFVGLGTAIRIGADEDFELAKAVQLIKGNALYSEVWNDQPAFHTALTTLILKSSGLMVAGPRLLTVFLSAVLIGAMFLIILRACCQPFWAAPSLFFLPDLLN